MQYLSKDLAGPSREGEHSGVGTLVVGLDESAAARSAGGFAAEIAERGGGRIVLVGVRPPVPSFNAPTLPGVERVTRALVSFEENEQLLAVLADHRDALGLGLTRLRAEVGDPAICLANVAVVEGAALIVVGTRGQGAARAAVLGTVVGDLLADAPVPVLAVPAVVASRAPSSIVCGVVEGVGSASAARVASRIAFDLGCALMLVHVIEGGENVRTAEALLAGVAETLGWPPRTIIRRGAVAGQLLDVAEAHGSSVIAVGPRGRGPLKAAVLGSTSRDILVDGRFALLAAPPPAIERLQADAG